MPDAKDLRSGLSPVEKMTMVGLFVAIMVFTIACFAAATLIGRSYLVLAGLGTTAFIFGLRHGVDADHIAAIDNTTRKLLQEGKRPLTVDTWFSLGHSTVVVGLIVALVFATRAVTGIIPSLQSSGAVIGTLVSGTFLSAIGLINVVIVVEIYRIFKSLRGGGLDESQLEAALEKRGFMNRYFKKFFRIVEKPWQI
jgi:high-affinity nickel-transport protein